MFCRRSKKYIYKKYQKVLKRELGTGFEALPAKMLCLRLLWCPELANSRPQIVANSAAAAPANARRVQDFQFMVEERVETGGTDLDRWIRRHRCGERVGGGRICNRSWPLVLACQRSADLERVGNGLVGGGSTNLHKSWPLDSQGWGESESGKSLVVAGLCTDLDRWILLPKDLRPGGGRGS